MKEIWEQHKLLIIVVAILLAIALLFVFGGWIAGTIGTIFGGTGAKKLQDYIKNEQQSDAKIAAIEDEKRAKTAAYVAQEKNLRAEQEAQARRDQVEVRDLVGGAKTREEINRAVDKEADALDAELKREGGHANMGVLFVLLLTWLILLLLCIPLPGFSSPASMPTSMPTQTEIQRAERVILLLRRARRALENQRAKHALELLRMDIEHKAELKKAGVQLATCQKQKLLLATPNVCPPCWQPALVTGLVVAGVCGVAWGSVEVGRHLGRQP